MSKAFKVLSLQDLKQVKREVAARAVQAATEKLAAEQRARLHQAQSNLFKLAIGKVTQLPDAPRASTAKPPAPPLAFQQQLDDAAVMREAIGDDFDFETLLDTDSNLSFRRGGLGTDVLRKLRRGEWRIQAQCDLHGHRVDEAREALTAFIRESHKMGLRCVRVVHGKGLGSPGKAPVLKGKVQGWLIQKSQVLAFVQAKPSDGGAGALVVLLERA